MRTRSLVYLKGGELSVESICNVSLFIANVEQFFKYKRKQLHAFNKNWHITNKAEKNTWAIHF